MQFPFHRNPSIPNRAYISRKWTAAALPCSDRYTPRWSAGNTPPHTLAQRLVSAPQYAAAATFPPHREAQGPLCRYAAPPRQTVPRTSAAPAPAAVLLARKCPKERALCHACRLCNFCRCGFFVAAFQKQCYCGTQHFLLRKQAILLFSSW